MRYRVCGLTLISDASLPELTPLTDPESHGATGIRVRFGMRRDEEASPSHWFMSWTLPTGELWLSCAKETRGYRLRFPDLADFLVDFEGLEIACEAWPETPPATIRHLLLDQVLPLVLTLRGRQALHATAVLTPHGVCAFAGPAGAGKSTLAASFLLAGYPVLSDDCLVLDEDHQSILATPAYPGLRLWDDTLVALGEALRLSLPVAHYTSKQRVFALDQGGAFLSNPHPVARIYCLEWQSEMKGAESLHNPIIEDLSHRDGFMKLITSTFLLDIADPMMLARQFHFLERVVSRVPIRRLRIPDTFLSLPAVRETILADLNHR
jgi:hypothetical protein